jgi:putative tricarboxylic transport membrane protein
MSQGLTNNDPMFDPLLIAAAQITEPYNLLLVFLGTVTGLIFGFLPGVTLLTAMALFLPFTYGMKPISVMFLFSGIMGSAPFGGSISAILFNIPGEPFNAATCFDGYPMAKKGEASRALGISAMASAVGGIIGLVVLIVLIPAIRPILFAFGPPEFFMIILFGLVTIAVAVPGNMTRGLVSAGLGILISLIGFSPVTGILRFNMGNQNYLWDGVRLVPFFIGIFALKEILEYFVKGGTISLSGERVNAGFRGVFQGTLDVFRHWYAVIQGSIVGLIIGILPGVGGTVSNFLAYTLAMQTSKHPERFGTGVPEAIVAVESSNNSKDGGDLLPTVAFGIPGSSTMALLLGAFILHGLNPGPLFIRDHLDIVWALIVGRVVSNIIASALGLVAADFLARVTTLNVMHLVPVILILSFIGAYADRENLWDILLAIGAGLFGYVLSRFGFPIITLVIGFVLGDLAERAFLQSLQMSFGDYSIFFVRPVSLTLFLFILIAFLFPLLKGRQRKVRTA